MCRERTRIQYQTVRPSMPSPLVQIAIVRAQARKIMNPCAKWRMFFVLPRLPDGRGSCILNGEGKKTAKAGSALSKNHPTRGPRQESQDRRECAIDRNVKGEASRDKSGCQTRNERKTDLEFRGRAMFFLAFPYQPQCGDAFNAIRGS